MHCTGSECYNQYIKASRDLFGGGGEIQNCALLLVKLSIGTATRALSSKFDLGGHKHKLVVVIFSHEVIA